MPAAPPVATLCRAVSGLTMWLQAVCDARRCSAVVIGSGDSQHQGRQGFSEAKKGSGQAGGPALTPSTGSGAAAPQGAIPFLLHGNITCLFLASVWLTYSPTEPHPFTSRSVYWSDFLCFLTRLLPGIVLLHVDGSVLCMDGGGNARGGWRARGTGRGHPFCVMRSGSCSAVLERNRCSRAGGGNARSKWRACGTGRGHPQEPCGGRAGAAATVHHAPPLQRHQGAQSTCF